MKKILLSFLLMVPVSLAISQTPCVIDYKINNGGGQCPDLNGTMATGTITLSFVAPIDPLNIPSIETVFDITDASTPIEVTDIDFAEGVLFNNGDVKYCYYDGPNKNNNLQSHNAQYRFFISYNGVPCGDQGALPVSFRSFTALRSNSIVSIKWTTSTESNNLGFEIQRLIGNGSWQTVSFVSTQAINGNSSTDLIYAYSDLNTTRGISQYRIRQVDIDNRSKLSEIRAVRGQGQIAKTIVYPNPGIDGKVSVIFEDVEAVRNVSLMDVNGRMIKLWKNIRNNTLQIENLFTGFYSLRIVNAETGEQSVEKFVVKNR